MFKAKILKGKHIVRKSKEKNIRSFLIKIKLNFKIFARVFIVCLLNVFFYQLLLKSKKNFARHILNICYSINN